MTDTTLAQRLRAELEKLASKGELIVYDMADDRGLDIDEYVELIAPLVETEIASLRDANKALTAENTRLIEKGFGLISERDEARRALEIACRNEASSDLDAAQSFLASKGE